MKKYKVTVNGTAYEIELEVIDKADVKAPAVQAAPAAENKPAAPVAPVSNAGGETISSPMPGTILDVKVSNGASVKKGDVLMILEAMKMENEIMAGADGTVTAVAVSKGASVQTGDMLCTIK